MNLKGGKEGKEQARSLAIQTFPDSAAQLNRKKDHKCRGRGGTARRLRLPHP